MKNRDIFFFAYIFLGIGLGVIIDILLNKYDNIGNTRQIILAIILISSSIPFCDELGYRRNKHRP